jgi:Uma2 family endonuclease
MVQTKPGPPTRADLDALPSTMKGEIIDGVLYAMTRPRARHQAIARRIGSTIGGAFESAEGGPGGWWILPEPGIELPDSPEVSPDLAGWRRERLPRLPEGALTATPDWVCEILSPTTRRHDWLVKKPFYARIGVPWLWLVDADALTVVVCECVDGAYRDVAIVGGGEGVRLPPFDGVTVDVGAWWRDLVAAP